MAHQSDGDGLEVYDSAESYGSDPWAGLLPRSEYLNLSETKLEEHLHALQIMHREQSAPLGGRLHQNMSLIMFRDDKGGRDVGFVHWIRHEEYFGKRIHLDGKGRLVSLVPSRNPRQTFEDVRVLIPDVGMRGDRRVEVALRCPAPPIPLTLLRMSRVAVMQTNGESFVVGCARCNATGPVVLDSDLGTSTQCSLCLLALHRECAQLGLEELRTRPLQTPRSATTLPDFMHASLCCLFAPIFPVIQQ